MKTTWTERYFEIVIPNEAKDYLAMLDPLEMILRFAQDDIRVIFCQHHHPAVPATGTNFR